MLSGKDVAEAMAKVLIQLIQNPEAFPVELNINEELKNNIFRIIDEFIKDSTRARPIFIADVLDKQLAQTIRDNLHDDNTKELKTDTLLGEYKPIHSFANRITLAYRLGLIPQGIMRELRLIKKIRNEFAHNWLVDHFDDDATKYLSTSNFYPVAKDIFSNSTWAKNGITQKDIHISVLEISFLFYSLYMYIALVAIKQHYSRTNTNLQQLFERLNSLFSP